MKKAKKVENLFFLFSVLLSEYFNVVKPSELILMSLFLFFFATACAAFIHTNFARLTTLNNDVLHVNFTRRLAASLAE